MPVEVVAALIAALASLVVAVLTYLLQRRHETKLADMRRSFERELEQLRQKSETNLAALNSVLAEAQAERDAERDYRYEARKRLYAEIQPLLFQLKELSEQARGRIMGLAHTSRRGELNWLAGGYYLLSTIYRFAAPLAIFRLIQRRLTVVDFSVDDRIRFQYAIAKQLYSSAGDGFELAAAGVHPIPYHPHQEDNERDADPAVHSQQHLPLGQIDIIAETLVVREPDGTLRCMTFGEFETLFQDKDSDVHRSTAGVAEVFQEFAPLTKPVLWRILVAQVYLYNAFLRTFEVGSESLISPRDLLSAEERQALDWRRQESWSWSPAPSDKRDRNVSTEEALEWPSTAAEQFLAERLSLLFHD